MEKLADISVFESVDGMKDGAGQSVDVFNYEGALKPTVNFACVDPEWKPGEDRTVLSNKVSRCLAKDLAFFLKDRFGGLGTGWDALHSKSGEGRKAMNDIVDGLRSVWIRDYRDGEDVGLSNEMMDAMFWEVVQMCDTIYHPEQNMDTTNPKAFSIPSGLSDINTTKQDRADMKQQLADRSADYKKAVASRPLQKAIAARKALP